MPALSVLEPLWPFLAFALGLIVGSFANVCIHRLPLEQSIVHPGSHCPRCGTPITAVDNIPLLSYLLLLGRCRVCRAPISARYPLVELGNGLLYLGVAVVEGPGPHAVVTMAFVTALGVLALIDLDHKMLPNVITLPGIAFGLAASLLAGPPTPLASAVSAAVGYGAFMAIARAWEALRGIEALGQGDWKMAAMLGAFFGWEKLLVTVFLATLAGSVVGVVAMVTHGRGLKDQLPLGTFLGAAGVTVVFAGDLLVDTYRQFMLLQG
jgi:leader peptidase (prepilin peptidase)/N-methyltransferase